MSALTLRADQRQHQALSPRLQQAVRLLQLSSMEFAQEVRQALDSNPFLEPVEDEGPPLPQGLAIGGILPASAVGEGPGDPGPESDPEIDAVPGTGPDAAEERDDWHLAGGAAGGGSDAPRGDDGESSPMNRVAAPTSLADALHGQLHVLPLPPRDLTLAKAIVDSLDDDGYLRLDSLDELVEVTALDPPATPDELQIALRRVQSLEPAGVGARNVVECLSLQLGAIACPEQRALARLIIAERLDALAGKDMAALARILGRPLPLVADACAAIRRLDPRPGWRLGHADIRYVTPDVIVRRGHSRWLVQLNPAVVPRVRLHRVYADLFSRQRGDESHPQMAEQLREARWTLRNVEQRFATILGVAQAIVKRQHLFFDYGPPAMKPLGLREIADEVGVHESTVSRVTSNKYIATPSGVFELKYFFSRAMTAGDGGLAYSGTAVRGLIKEMLEQEEAGQRLSDAEITRRLARQGLVVARRTVTKYRHQLRVDSVGRRRADEAQAARDGAVA
ncbi:RNA polymerase factor sigma-54 [Rhizobacter sp. SG703]|uniref:RNA polymerase factor sigma-54 n=1 Tax=Rhizobacter sp. SG703 TaxID=2587140 RepID=UPI001447A08B|nr:RNA polymerase factor sigma-54 [Rhizobacter sp. SG703]NKI92531.1 RNA polymerase sigma-54 factor [Rhizobacter sp. SG703]